ncbi:MAG: hypothetical protein JSR21_04945 [Proteobacteria bacterium]|nr:hypothetical protein [Pseudomonadota bacterium]
MALSDDAGSDRLPAAMARDGARCAVLCPPGYRCAGSHFIERHFALPSHGGLWLGALFAARRLIGAAEIWRPDLVVPLDDVAGLVLRGLARHPQIPAAIRRLIETSLGDPIGYEAAGSRVALMRVASGLPLPLPPHGAASDPDAALAVAAAIGYPVVLKSEHTCGGHGVAVAGDPEQLRALYRHRAGLSGAPQRWRAACRRAVWRLSGVAEAGPAPPLLQQFIAGRMAMRTVAAWRGRVLAGASFIAEEIHPPPFGPSSLVRPIEHAGMRSSVAHLVGALGASGFLSFDFILDSRDTAWLIELNARPIGTTHLGALLGEDLPAALLAASVGASPPPVGPDLVGGRAIALFPRELMREPADAGRFGRLGILHDVPYDDPILIAGNAARLRGSHPEAAAAIARLVADAGSDAAPCPPGQEPPATCPAPARMQLSAS